MYYVGILNNAEDIQEAANYSLTVRASQQGPLCPWNCNGNGNCLSNGVCNCNAGEIYSPRTLLKGTLKLDMRAII